jgi:tRNA (cmo5U34)-methyltransferase
MNDAVRAAVESYFDAEKAAGYDERIRGRIPGYDTLHEMAADLVAQELPSKGRVLVVGAGTGEEVVRYARLAPGVRITALDPSRAMLRAATARVAQAGLGEQVRLVEGLVEDAPPDQVDAAAAILVMHFIPDDGSKAACLSEIARRLRPGGLLVTADMVGSRGTPGFESVLGAWARWRARRGADAEELSGYFRRVREELHIVTEDRYRALLREAGFTEIERFFGAFSVGGWIARFR